jgi:acetyl esterase/lipase
LVQEGFAPSHGSLLATKRQQAQLAERRIEDAGGPSVAAQALIYPVADATMDMPSCAEFEDYALFNTDDLRWLIRRCQHDPLRRNPPLAQAGDRLVGYAARHDGAA